MAPGYRSAGIRRGWKQGIFPLLSNRIFWKASEWVVGCVGPILASIFRAIISALPQCSCKFLKDQNLILASAGVPPLSQARINHSWKLPSGLWPTAKNICKALHALQEINVGFIILLVRRPGGGATGLKFVRIEWGIPTLAKMYLLHKCFYQCIIIQ